MGVLGSEESRTKLDGALGPHESAGERGRERLRARHEVRDDVLEAWHGSPADEDAYLVWIDDIRDAAALGRRPLCLFGHTHVQGAYGSGAGHPVVESGGAWTRTTLSIRLEDRWLINPGSVGQPRDGDPRAAYALVDLGASTITLRRIEYDIAAEQAAIRAAGLPELLASRLGEGR